MGSNNSKHGGDIHIQMVEMHLTVASPPGNPENIRASSDVKTLSDRLSHADNRKRQMDLEGLAILALE